MSGHDHDARVLSDEALLSYITQGCEDCFALLYARFHRSLLNLSRRILRDSREAEDIVQEVFLAIYEQRERFDPSLGPARTWVLQFGYYKSLRRRRDLSRHQFFEQGLAAEEYRSNPLFVQPEFIQRSVETKELTDQALCMLAPSQQRVIELLHFEGHTLREISEMERKELAAIRNRYYKALSALRTILGKGKRQLARPVPVRGREEYEIEL